MTVVVLDNFAVMNFVMFTGYFLSVCESIISLRGKEKNKVQKNLFKQE